MESNRSPDSLHTRKIVVGVDFEELGASALRSAMALASSLGDTEVHAVFSGTERDGSEKDLDQLGAEIERMRLFVDDNVATYQQQFGEAPTTSVVVHRTSGEPAAAINRFAVALRASMIVVGTHGRQGLKRAILGSVAENVVRRATCPVLVMRPISHPIGVETISDEAEPICPECETVRQSSHGKELWCPRHAEKHDRAEAYMGGRGGGGTNRPWGF